MGVRFHLNSPIEMEKIKENHPNFNFYLDARGVVQTPVLFDPNFAKTNVAEGGNHSLAMDFLTYCNKFHEAQKQENLAGVQNNLTHPFIEFKLGKEIVVLGNGDTAEDVKRTILKLNSQLNEREKVELITINRQPQESERAKLGSNYPRRRETGSLDLHHETNHEENVSQRIKKN
jgi:NADPH-dependent glutamate synthase beta subunit-like oxidoreductase